MWRNSPAAVSGQAKHSSKPNLAHCAVTAGGANPAELEEALDSDDPKRTLTEIVLRCEAVASRAVAVGTVVAAAPLAGGGGGTAVVGASAADRVVDALVARALEVAVALAARRR